MIAMKNSKTTKVNLRDAQTMMIRNQSLKRPLQIDFKIIVLYFTREHNDTTRENRDLLNTTNSLPCSFFFLKCENITN